jgi:cobaltochelatase CobN
VITNTRDPGNPEMTSIDKFIGTEFRSRYMNPTWIEGMKKEGYAGAGEMRSFVEYLWGWDATVTETVTDQMWKESFDVYVADKNNLGMKEFFEQKSPYAFQDITARMLETVRKGYWNADAATQKTLLEEYVASVNRHGVGCAEHTCGNPRLQQFVMEQGAKAGIPVPALEGYKQAMEKATGQTIDPAAERMQSFAQKNDEQMAANLATIPTPSRNARQLEGYVMEQRTEAERNEARRDAAVNEYAALWASMPVLALLLVWRYKRRRSL